MEEFLSLKENGCGHQVQVGKTVRRLDFLRKEVAIRKVGQAKLDSKAPAVKTSSPKTAFHTQET